VPALGRVSATMMMMPVTFLARLLTVRPRLI
jgi:hypothetical protein